MSASRIKNLVLLILLLTCAFLLIAVVPKKTEKGISDRALYGELEQYCASNGVKLDPEGLPESRTLYTVELEAGGEDSAAAAILGNSSERRSEAGSYESVFTSETGTMSISRDGRISVQFTLGKTVRDREEQVRNMLRNMNYEIADLSAEDSGQIRTLQAVLNTPVFESDLAFSYSGGLLTGIEGVLYPASAEVKQVSSQASVSCADAVVAFLRSRDALGWVGTQVLEVRQGYLHTDTAVSAIRFVPCWKLVTDTDSYYVNGISGEIRQISG